MTGTTDKPGIALACCGLIGTLVADEGLVERSFAEAIATQGVVSGTSAFARRMSQVHQARGRSAADVLRLLFPDNEARAQAAQLAFDRALADAVGRVAIHPVPGAVQVLDQLRAAGIAVCVLTSLPRRVLDRVVDAAGLGCHIDLALSPDDVPRGFPAPDLVLMAVLRTGTGSVGEVAVIHGTGAGVEGGRRSGASIVAGVLTGPHPARRLRSAGATDVLESIADLPAVMGAGDAAFRPDVWAASENGDSGWMKPPQPATARPVAPEPDSGNPASVDVPAQAPFGRRSSGR
ncbi:MAG TPA: HAD family phosphatase [Streptosporangiaceae bacterium]|nr:HAD family phosphatase [Streptosporangiaceae bacterium]